MFKRKEMKHGLEFYRQFATKKFDEHQIPNIQTEPMPVNGAEYRAVMDAIRARVEPEQAGDLSIKTKGLITSSNRYEFCKIISEPNSPWMQTDEHLVHEMMASVLHREAESERFHETGIGRL